MDAVKFIEEHRRMCRTYYGCDGCLAHNDDDGSCRFSTIVGDGADEQIALLEKWSAAHPRKTRQDLFLEQYPNAKTSEKGILYICPIYVDKNTTIKYSCICSTNCSDCRREFWMQEVE